MASSAADRLRQILAAHTALLARLRPDDRATLQAQLDQEAARVRDWICRERPLSLDAVARFLDDLRTVATSSHILADHEMAKEMGLKIAATCQLAQSLQ